MCKKICFETTFFYYHSSRKSSDSAIFSINFFSFLPFLAHIQLSLKLLKTWFTKLYPKRAYTNFPNQNRLLFATLIVIAHTHPHTGRDENFSLVRIDRNVKRKIYDANPSFPKASYTYTMRIETAANCKQRCDICICMLCVYVHSKC